VGFHLGEEDVTIDYNTRITLEEALSIEEQANRYLWENHPFEELWPTAEELKDLEYRSKKELEGDVRITRFPGADTCACCGTHVRCSAEVGLVKIVSAHNFHEGTRLVLLCGKRAMDFLNRNYQANKQTAVLLSTKEERTPEIVKKQQEDLISLKAKLSRLEEDYFRLWAESFAGKKNALVITDQIDAEEGRALCDAIADQISGLAAVFTRTQEADQEGPVYRYACMKRGGEIGDLIKEMNEALSGRGGGRNGFAQGSVKADQKKIHTFFTSKNLTNE
jgi:alanyl-tRNA synthetase